MEDLETLASRIVESLHVNGEAVVPYLDAESFVEKVDKTREFVTSLLQINGLESIGGKKIVSFGRTSEVHGHHYWVGAMKE
jgi:hypothetical protein